MYLKRQLPVYIREIGLKAVLWSQPCVIMKHVLISIYSFISIGVTRRHTVETYEWMVSRVSIYYCAR